MGATSKFQAPEACNTARSTLRVNKYLASLRNYLYTPATRSVKSVVQNRGMQISWTFLNSREDLWLAAPSSPGQSIKIAEPQARWRNDGFPSHRPGVWPFAASAKLVAVYYGAKHFHCARKAQTG